HLRPQHLEKTVNLKYDHALLPEQGQQCGRLRRLHALREELSRMAERCRGGTVGDCRIIETLADFTHGHCQDSRHPGDG
ncbi:MAG: hypothetical protein ACK4ST_15730, partial [Elioraea tepidiphila]